MTIDPRTFEKHAGKRMDPYAAGGAHAQLSAAKSARDLRGPTMIGIIVIAILAGCLMYAKFARSARRAEQRAAEPPALRLGR